MAFSGVSVIILYTLLLVLDSLKGLVDNKKNIDYHQTCCLNQIIMRKDGCLDPKKELMNYIMTTE